MGFIYHEGIRFKCQRCSICCGDTKDKVRRIFLLEKEVEIISKITSKTIEDISEKIEGFEPYTYVMRKTKEGVCTFLNDNTCSIYEIRPLVCRFYPFQLQSSKNDQYYFTYTEECPGIGKGPLLKRIFYENLFKEFLRSKRSIS
jgi:Fe-S-cluster containining protein